MLCDCLTDLEKRLEETGEYFEPRFKNKAISFATGSYVLNIPFEYREKKKDGSFKKNNSTSFVTVNFCPFCGKPAKKEKEIANA